MSRCSYPNLAVTFAAPKLPLPEPPKIPTIPVPLRIPGFDLKGPSLKLELARPKLPLPEKPKLPFFDVPPCPLDVKP